MRIANDYSQAGLLAVVSLPLSVSAQSTLIPVSAVLNLHGRAFVYRVEENVVKRVPVQLGRRIDDEVIILGGLLEGQNIVARDVNSLSDNQQVVTE